MNSQVKASRNGDEAQKNTETLDREIPKRENPKPLAPKDEVCVLADNKRHQKKINLKRV